MPSYYQRRRKKEPWYSQRPLVAFLLIASFGILFVGCGGSSTGQQGEEFVFTESDIERFRELIDEDGENGAKRDVPHLTGDDVMEEESVVDLSQLDIYKAIRAADETGGNLYRVTNEFLNVRSQPSITSEAILELGKGDTIEVIDFIDAAWAKIKLPEEKEGYVAMRYIAKLVAEERLSEEKKAFEGMYFVDFGFLNVRAAPDAQSEKLGELPGQAIVRPLHTDEVWARILFEGKEGYIAVQYLTPFLPNFRVRQEEYALPTLHYHVHKEGMLDALAKHIDALTQEGYSIITTKALRDLVLAQQDRDVRLDPKQVLLAISGVTAETLEDVSSLLRASGIQATLFLASKDIGLEGITESQILSLVSAGHDIQSAAHTGDDLRSLTNAQVELELNQSRGILEELTGTTVFAVAYPLGGVNQRIAEAAEKSGYLFGLGNGAERVFSRSQFLTIPSFIVSSKATDEEVLAIVKGE